MTDGWSSEEERAKAYTEAVYLETLAWKFQRYLRETDKASARRMGQELLEYLGEGRRAG